MASEIRPITPIDITGLYAAPPETGEPICQRNVPGGITDRVLAEVDRLDREFVQPTPSKTRN